MNYIMYCAFGDKRYVYETILSIKSFIDVNKKILNKIVVYTTKSLRKIFEENLFYSDLIFEILTEEEIKNSTYVNGIKYIPRIKIIAIEDFLKRYKCPVIFVDTDTLFLSSIDDIHTNLIRDPTTCFLYTKCLSIKDFYKQYKKLLLNETSADVMLHYRICRKLIKNNLIPLDYEDVILTQDFHQYNSGVIAVPESVSNMTKKVLELSDYLLATYNFYWAEEFAFSYFLQRYYHVESCDCYIYHYNDKWVRLFLSKYYHAFFEEDEKEFLKLVERYSIENEFLEGFEVKKIPHITNCVRKKMNLVRNPYYDDTSYYNNYEKM